MQSIRAGLLYTAALLGACTSPPPAQPPVVAPAAAAPRAFRLEGRISARSGEEQFSGGITWRHGPDRDEILLTTPLGQGVAELQAGPEGAVLVDSKGRRHEAEDSETLLRRTSGLNLPLRGLGWWAVGHPSPQSPAIPVRDSLGRMESLEQDGWRIEFSRHAQHQGVILPSRLVARRGEELEVRLVTDVWELP